MSEEQEVRGGQQPSAQEKSTASTPAAVASEATAAPVAPSGRRQAFRDIRRQLTDDDLANPGVQRLILEELERAEEQCETLQTYVDRFYEADKRAAVLEAAASSEKTVEILFRVGVGLGGTLIGLSPSLWQEGLPGVLVLVVGIVLVGSTVVVQAVRR